MLLAAGTRLGTYEILAPLGAGGMGQVYRARDIRLEREVAVKLLPEAVGASPERLAQLEREARTLAGLNHPNIVTLYAVEDEDGLRFLTMELVEGSTLETLIAPGGLPWPRVLALAIPLADALVAAHARGIVHRDLKPGNVMLTGEGRLKVLDFGLADRAAATLPEGRTLSSAPTTAAPATPFAGTVPYMAPEQLRGEPAAIASIAVLPFVNRSRDEEHEYFSDGLADELLDMLAKIRGLRVPARSSSFQFRGTGETVATIGRRLNVATLLDGSVRRAGKRARISVQLVKVADGFHLWSETYDRELDDLFAVQDDIAQSVVKALRTTLLGEQVDSGAAQAARSDVARAAKGRGRNPEAHRLYLLARYHLDRVTREDTDKGIAALRQALDLEADFALAWAVLGQAHARVAEAGWGNLAEDFETARAAARRALALEPDLAKGYAALGRVLLVYDWDLPAAAAAMDRALQLAPGNAAVLRAAGELARSQGRFADALALIRRALAQDPLSANTHTILGLLLHAVGELGDAEAMLRQALSLAPGRVGTHAALALVLLAQGRAPEAFAECAAEPDEVLQLWASAIVGHVGGRAEESAAALRELREKYAEDCAYQIAEGHAARGEHVAALDWLERAYAQRDGGLITELKSSPWLAALAGDPRWARLLDQLGLTL